MKKSNKLLLGGFLTVVLTVAGLHIALFAKFKNGDYTIYHQEDKKKDDGVQSFPNASFVVVRNVGGATVRFGERAEVKKRTQDPMQVVQKGDSLIIASQSDDHYYGERGVVDITLSDNVTLFVVNSSLYFEGDAGQLSIVTDSISRLSLQSKHLLKTKITTIPNNP